MQAYKGNYGDAYNNLLVSINLNDSVFSQRNKNAIANIESQKEIDLKNKEIELNTLTIENNKKKKWFYLASIALLAVIGFLLVKQNRHRKTIN